MEVKKIVFIAADQEYSSEQTLPALGEALRARYGHAVQTVTSKPDHRADTDIPGLEALDSADLAVLYLRWQQIPADQLKHIEDYLASGKPMVGLRTSTHAFNYAKGHPLEKWNRFGALALGAPPGWGNGHTHYGHNSSTDVARIPAARRHPVLEGVPEKFHVRSWLYHVLPNYPPPDAVRLLEGTAVNPDNKAAIPNPVAWTWRNPAGGRIFTTTMGHPEDFSVEAFQRLLVNGVHWALGEDKPRKWGGELGIRVPYRSS